ncbi:MAG: formate/nitrite transporter family protein [Chloroflexi bacterium]|nr:formate/nitrite transporter family protein [Chloroflexota bacterium]
MNDSNVIVQIDPYSPMEMAERAEKIGLAKVRLSAANTVVLAILAGSFIALGALFSTIVSTDTGVGYGINRLLAGAAFSLGLILVVIAGAELFTGNNLIVMAFAARKVRIEELARNWVLVYIGNFVGAALTALAIYWSLQWTADNFKVGANALALANTKVNLTWEVAFVRGIIANALVCLAVWLAYSARSNTDKILSIIPPITAFVAAGMEHCIANMYFVPLGIFLANEPAVVQAAGLSADKLTNLNWVAFVMNNLIPSTLGNIVGGAVLVGFIYWFVFMRTRPISELPRAISTRIREWLSKKMNSDEGA